MNEFWKYPMKYKERVTYNNNANKFLDNNILINDYLSGNYKITQNKKIISQTLIKYGFTYSKVAIEMTNNNNYEEDTDEETSHSIKVEEDKKNSTDL